jgi:hypothetical protein
VGGAVAEFGDLLGLAEGVLGGAEGRGGGVAGGASVGPTDGDLGSGCPRLAIDACGQREDSGIAEVGNLIDANAAVQKADGDQEGQCELGLDDLGGTALLGRAVEVLGDEFRLAGDGYVGNRVRRCEVEGVVQRDCGVDGSMKRTAQG